MLGLGMGRAFLDELARPVESEDPGEEADSAAAFAAGQASAIQVPDPSVAETPDHKPAPSDPSPSRGGLDVGKLVAGGFTVVSTSIAIVGGITGAVSRFLRNNPIPLLAALILSVAAVGVSLAGSELAMASMNARPRGKRAG